jgi:hypothetical protein
MRRFWKLAASSVALAALGVTAVTAAAAANPHQTYTCVRTTPSGNEVRVEVPEPAVSGLTNAGFNCVPNPPGGGGEEDPNEDPGNGDPGNGDPGNGEPGNEATGNAPGPTAGASNQPLPEKPRAIFCSTNGPAFRANGEGMGIALNLLDEQGALLVEQGVVVPAMYYEGIGASCDVLPGFVYAGIWVGHVGDVVPGVAVYPLFVRVSGLIR